MNNFKRNIGAFSLASLLAIAPLAASANTQNASSSAGIVISPSGIVRVIGADVTAVGTNVIDAILHIGNAAISVVLNTSGNTKVTANGSKTATTTDVKVGDTVAFKGALTSSTAGAVTVAATKVRDTTSFPFPRIALGTVSSVNTANSSFVVTNNNAATTVFINALTAISLNGSNSTLALLPVNSKVLVAGTKNSDGSITATKVIAGTQTNVQTDKKGTNDNDKNDDKGNAGKKDGLRLGLNLFGGLHLGNDK